jgi:hypothetical protein
MPRRTRPTKPLPEPADATFPVLLQEAAQSGPRRRRAWAQLIDHLIAGERDAEQEELRGLMAYCHERVDLLNSRDADFIVSMKRIVERYAVLLGEHKPCKTPANQCTLTLLPFC